MAMKKVKHGTYAVMAFKIVTVAIPWLTQARLRLLKY